MDTVINKELYLWPPSQDPVSAVRQTRYFYIPLNGKIPVGDQGLFQRLQVRF